MGEYHPAQENWVEREGKLLACGMSQCLWAMVTSGLDTKGDIYIAYSRHLSRHDEQLSRQLDEFLGG
jgi:hypothetical protein